MKTLKFITPTKLLPIFAVLIISMGCSKKPIAPIVNETENKADIGIIVLQTDSFKSLPCGGVKIIPTVIYSANFGVSFPYITKPKNLVITTLNQWNDLKINIQNYDETGLDFSKHFVIASIYAIFSTGGFSIDNTEIVENKNNISVYVKHGFPKPNEPVTQSITQPCKIIRIPKTNKPILFELE